jgi:DNA mismatch endonuclease (patch repair protein)
VVDSLTKEQRSERMSRIRGKDSAAELAVRRLVFSMGYRYRLHGKGLPGKPDLVFPSRHKVIFVHGCFWHQHGCGRYKEPKSNVEFWLPKLQSNLERDQRNTKALADLGWSHLVVWECEIRDEVRLKGLIKTFLDQ